jgi:hypothetical protein
MIEENVRQLIAAILLQAVEDYVSEECDRKTILRELRSKHMERLTGDMGRIVAERLEFHLDEVAENMGKAHSLEEAI